MSSLLGGFIGALSAVLLHLPELPLLCLGVPKLSLRFGMFSQAWCCRSISVHVADALLFMLSLADSLLLSSLVWILCRQGRYGLPRSVDVLLPRA